jgi:hypothetical protein
LIRKTNRSSRLAGRNGSERRRKDGPAATGLRSPCVLLDSAISKPLGTFNVPCGQDDIAVAIHNAAQTIVALADDFELKAVAASNLVHFNHPSALPALVWFAISS